MRSLLAINTNLLVGACGQHFLTPEIGDVLLKRLPTDRDCHCRLAPHIWIKTANILPRLFSFSASSIKLRSV